ncbi:MAG: 30S ribosomal protein S3 [Candidatus Omnitrophota bacterium]
MGQKVHPLLLRIGITKDWHSTWFANKKNYYQFIQEDFAIRKFIKERLNQAAIARVIIQRMADKLVIRINSARPGVIIGRHGSEIERLRSDLQDIIKKDFNLEIEEIKNPAIEAQLIAENIAFQLIKRIAFKRAIKRAMEQAMNSGLKGIKVTVSGRLAGAEIARRETYKEGKVPLQTFRADIDYGFSEALTTYGLIGVKVWAYKGDIIPGVKQSLNPEV